MRHQGAYAKQVAATRSDAANQASTAETVALTLVVTIALTSVAIGAWSMLAFFNNLASNGAGGVLKGFFQAITG